VEGPDAGHAEQIEPLIMRKFLIAIVATLSMATPAAAATIENNLRLENDQQVRISLRFVIAHVGHSLTDMQPNIIVWDLETVPDIRGFAAANDLAGKSDVEVREAIGDKFPKHIYHSIVCIGALSDTTHPLHVSAS
jgi:hypothetical protein